MIFTGGFLGAPAAYMLAALTVCAPQTPPTVQMSFINNPPVEIDDQTSAQLGTHKISTTFSRSHNEIFNVEGLTVSDIQPEYRIQFAILTDPASGLACVAPSQVAIRLTYTPSIYIASEVQKGTCNYGVTLQHEVRHVNTDILTFNEYLPQITAAVQAAVNQIAPMGPTDDNGLTIAQNRMADLVKDALAAKFNELGKVRFNRQQMIDTRAEYLRLSALCQPGRN